MRHLNLLFIILFLYLSSCSNCSDVHNVYLDSTIESTHVTVYDKISDSISLFAKINDKELNLTTLYKSYHIGEHIELDYRIQNCGNGNILLSGNDFNFVIHIDSIVDCILSPVLAVDSVNSKLLYDNRSDSLVFSIFDIESLKKSDFTIKDINDSLYYFIGISANFNENGNLCIRYSDKNKVEKNSVIDIETR